MVFHLETPKRLNTEGQHADTSHHSECALGNLAAGRPLRVGAFVPQSDASDHRRQRRWAQRPVDQRPFPALSYRDGRRFCDHLPHVHTAGQRGLGRNLPLDAVLSERLPGHRLGDDRRGPVAGSVSSVSGERRALQPILCDGGVSALFGADRVVLSLLVQAVPSFRRSKAICHYHCGFGLPDRFRDWRHCCAASDP